MKVIIIEDELLTANDLADALKKADPAIEISAILASVSEAAAWLAAHESPDLVFSDIQLGDGLSFSLFKEHPVHVPVVFCTAYDEYALDAFQANGIDYILKPFTHASLHQTLTKFRHLQQRFTAKELVYDRMIASLSERARRQQNSILVYQNERIIPLAVADIALFFIHNKITLVLCLDEQVFMIGQSLDELEGICGPGFYRANRQYLISRKAIREVSHYYARKLVLKLNMHFKDPITISKEKYTDFLHWLSNA